MPLTHTGLYDKGKNDQDSSSMGIVDPVRTYTARAQYVDGQWVLEVPELPGLSRQVEWIVQAEATLRAAIASELEVKPESVGVEVVPVMRPKVAALVDEAAQARDEQMKVQRQVSATRKRAFDALRSDGISVQDAAKVLGITVRHPLGEVDPRSGAA